MKNKIYFVTAVETLDDFNLYNTLIPSMKDNWIRDMLVVENSEELDSIFKKYNHAIDKLINDSIGDDDIVCFLHSDIRIVDENLEEKLNMIFSHDKNIGMVGVYGTTQLDTFGWWLTDRKQHGRGHIIQGLPDGTKFHMQDRVGFFDDVVVIDGCFMATTGSVIKNLKFDEKTYDGYHGYDYDYCLEVITKLNKKICVADILLHHLSEGPLSSSWNESKEKFMNKWETKYTFPLTINTFVDSVNSGII